MFRIEKRHVKITDQQELPGPAQNAASQPQAAAPEMGEQPSFSAPESVAQAAPPQPEAPPQPLITEEMIAQAESQASELLEAARTAAEGILKEARANAEEMALEIRGQAWQAGHAEGVEAGMEALRQQGNALAADLEVLTQGLQAGKDDMYRRLEDDVIELSLAIAKKIVNTAIDRDDAVYGALIQNALNQMKLEGKLTIRLSQQDAARLFPGGTASFDLGDRRVVAQISADPYMKPGDCILESEAEMVDAGVDTQMAAITVAFEEIVASSSDKN